jgi:acyl-CoA thioester hydrolase
MAGEFTYTTTVPVRFRDLDVAGWAHNSVPLLYVEEARIDYFRDVLDQNILDMEGAIVHQSIDYEVPIRLDGAVTVHYRVSTVGETSLTMAFLIETPDGDRAASGEVVHAVLDDGDPSPVPETWRERILAFEDGDVEMA